MRDVYVRVLSRTGDLRATLREADPDQGDSAPSVPTASPRPARCSTPCAITPGSGKSTSRCTVSEHAADLSAGIAKSQTIHVRGVFARGGADCRAAFRRNTAARGRYRRASRRQSGNTLEYCVADAAARSGARSIARAAALLTESWAAGVPEEDRSWALRMDAVVQRLAGAMEPRWKVGGERATRGASAHDDEVPAGARAG